MNTCSQARWTSCRRDQVELLTERLLIARVAQARSPSYTVDSILIHHTSAAHSSSTPPPRCRAWPSSTPPLPSNRPASALRSRPLVGRVAAAPRPLPHQSVGGRTAPPLLAPPYPGHDRPRSVAGRQAHQSHSQGDQHRQRLERELRRLGSISSSACQSMHWTARVAGKECTRSRNVGACGAWRAAGAARSR